MLGKITKNLLLLSFYYTSSLYAVCPPGQITAGSACADCPENSKHYDAMHCICNAGYQDTPWSDGARDKLITATESCEVCPDGKYCTDTEILNCPVWPDNALIDNGNSHLNRISSDLPRTDVTNCYAYHLHLWDGTGVKKSALSWNIGDYSCYSTGVNDRYTNCPHWTYVSCGTGYYMDSLTGGTNKCLPCPDGFYCPSVPVDNLNTTLYNGDKISVRDVAIDPPVACTNKPDNSRYIGTGSSTNSCSWVCNHEYELTSSNTCAQLCTSGVTKIKTSTGLNIPLYTTKQTAHVIAFKNNGIICYASLAIGQSENEININLDGVIYHTMK